MPADCATATASIVTVGVDAALACVVFIGAGEPADAAPRCERADTGRAERLPEIGVVESIERVGCSDSVAASAAFAPVSSAAGTGGAPTLAAAEVRAGTGPGTESWLVKAWLGAAAAWFVGAWFVAWSEPGCVAAT
jgi:hypothetical protein